jgi:hypothetical protein
LGWGVAIPTKMGLKVQNTDFPKNYLKSPINGHIFHYMPNLIKTSEMRKAIEAFASDPEITNEQVARLCNVHLNTIKRWRTSPEFVDAIYDTYMVHFGSELPAVLQAMISQAKAGNVQAGRLVLEHSGKLIKNVNVTIDSPFEKFLKTDASPIEYRDAEIQDIVDDIPDIQDVVLPEIKQESETPRERKKREIRDIKKEIGKEKRSIARKKMYKLRKRAEAVGLEPLGKKPSALERDNWVKEIERRENED